MSASLTARRCTLVSANAGVGDLTAGGAARGTRARARSTTRHRAGVEGRPHLAVLLLAPTVVGPSHRFRRDHDHVVHPAGDRGLRDRATWVRIRVPRGVDAYGRAAPQRCCVRVLLGDHAVLLRGGRRRCRLRSGADRRSGDPVTSWINPTSVLGGVLAVSFAATSRRSS